MLAGILVVALPRENIARLATLFGGAPVMVGIEAEAGESMDARQHLFEESVKYTFQYPVFGVGPGQFPNFFGRTTKALGEHSSWNETHNTYTQISSECGIPALLFAVAGLLSVFLLVNKSYGAAKAQQDKEITRVCLWYLTSMAGYLVTLAFLACAYRFTLPAMIGLGVAIHSAAQRRLLAAQPPTPVIPPVRKFLRGVKS
jgi:O-antigen ligase